MNKFQLLISCIFLTFSIKSQDNGLRTDSLNSKYLDYSTNAILSNKIQNKTLIGEKKDFQKLSFVGDIRNILSSQTINSKVENPFKNLKPDIVPEKILLEKINKNKVVIFNEAHDRTNQRVYLLKLLPHLRDLGFKKLALETLTNNVSSSSPVILSPMSGYYTTEPIMGQIYREALNLGFDLIAYDTDEANDYQRDSLQAQFLYQQIAKNGKLEKTIVLCGYGHLYEWGDNPNNYMMAKYFQDISGYNPLTIDQVMLSESQSSDFLRNMYNALKDSSLIIYDGRQGDLSKVLPPFCDYYVCHPETEFVQSKPKYIFESLYRFVSSFETKEPNIILVQAYMRKEFKLVRDFDKLVPYDQTTYLNNGCAYLALKPKEKYIIVFRDKNNSIVRRVKCKIR